VQVLGVGWQEMAVVFLLALVFIGPERMPRVAYQIGRAVRTMQAYARQVRGEFSEEFAYVEEQYKTVKGEITVAKQELKDTQLQLQTEIREATAPLQELPAAVSELSAGVSNVVDIASRAPVTAPVAESPAPTHAPSGSAAPPLVF
jgi:sec-independent protein translocase protein TatB